MTSDQAIRHAMTPLSLAPLPTTRADEDSIPWKNGQVGFVDDAVVARLLSPVGASRRGSCPEDLVLAADDMDFAGWQLAPAPSPSAFRGTDDIIETPPLSFRRATPPAAMESGTGSLNGSSHRWWLAGLAGVLAALLVTLLLLVLSSRPDVKDVPPPSAGQTHQNPADAPLADSPR